MIDIILKFINDSISSFNIYATSNPIIAGVVSLWGLSVLSYFGRGIPKKLWDILLRQSTTTMVLLSSSPIFYNFQTWFYNRGYSDKARSIKVSTGKWGEDTAVKSMGYGNHYFLYKHMPFKVNMFKIDTTNNIMERDEITITILGRSHKFFDLLFKEIQESTLKEDKVKVFKYNKDYWKPVSDQMKRDMSTIFLEENIKGSVLEHIDNFVSREKWYIHNGLSYQTGILLYGHPGCGKTSFIKALASKYNKDIYRLNAGMLYYIDSAVLDLPNNVLFLIEDIDADPALHERNVQPDNETPSKDNVLQISLTNFSDVLNSLDGIITIHGRILIATTNHIEKLDAALLRNGRFDLKVKMGYASNLIVEKFFKRYYPNFSIDFRFNIRDKIPASKIQNLILKNSTDPKKVLSLLQ